MIFPSADTVAIDMARLRITACWSQLEHLWRANKMLFSREYKIAAKTEFVRILREGLSLEHSYSPGRLADQETTKGHASRTRARITLLGKKRHGVGTATQKGFERSPSQYSFQTLFALPCPTRIRTWDRLLAVGSEVKIKAQRSYFEQSAPTRIRTWDRLLKRELLCQLSYRGTLPKIAALLFSMSEPTGRSFRKGSCSAN